MLKTIVNMIMNTRTSPFFLIFLCFLYSSMLNSMKNELKTFKEETEKLDDSEFFKETTGISGIGRTLDIIAQEPTSLFAQRVKKNRVLPIEFVVPALKQRLIDEHGNFNDVLAKKYSEFINKNTLDRGYSILSDYQERLEIDDWYKNFYTAEKREFLSYYMHSIFYMDLYSDETKTFMLYENYILPYCTGKNPIPLINVFLKSKKLIKDKLDFPTKLLPQMQDALFWYIIKISLLYYVLPITGGLLGAGGVRFLAVKYHKNPQIFQLWLQKLKKLSST